MRKFLFFLMFAFDVLIDQMVNKLHKVTVVLPGKYLHPYINV